MAWTLVANTPAGVSRRDLQLNQGAPGRLLASITLHAPGQLDPGGAAQSLAGKLKTELHAAHAKTASSQELSDLRQRISGFTRAVRDADEKLAGAKSKRTGPDLLKAADLSKELATIDKEIQALESVKQEAEAALRMLEHRAPGAEAAAAREHEGLLNGALAVAAKEAAAKRADLGTRLATIIGPLLDELVLIDSQLGAISSGQLRAWLV